VKEIIEKMRAAEEEAIRTVAAAEHDASEVMERARNESRDKQRGTRDATRAQVEGLLQEAHRAAQTARQELLAKAEQELKAVAAVDPSRLDEASRLVFQAVAYPPMAGGKTHA
jgi:vacuolar-type H+-ATPase subunit H